LCHRFAQLPFHPALPAVHLLSISAVKGSMTLSQKAASFAANAGSAHFGEGVFGRGSSPGFLDRKIAGDDQLVKKATLANHAARV